MAFPSNCGILACEPVTGLLGWGDNKIPTRRRSIFAVRRAGSVAFRT